MSVLRRFGINRGNWHRFYYALALFDVVIVTGSLFLTDRLAGIFDESVQANRAWTRRLDAYSTLGRLTAAVNTPGNDVFEKGDADLQEHRLAEAQRLFEGAIANARRDAEQTLSDPVRALIVADLDAIVVANDQMVAEARRIFGFFRAQEPMLGGRRMATTDHRYADLNAGLDKLRDDAIDAEGRDLDRQDRAAARLRRYEILIGAAILLMVGAATAYGHTISRRINADQAEREGVMGAMFAFTLPLMAVEGETT